MEKTDEIRSDDQVEYVAPTIVDYGDIVQITAANLTGSQYRTYRRAAWSRTFCPREVAHGGRIGPP